jgi:hypothetical protein
VIAAFLIIPFLTPRFVSSASCTSPYSLRAIHTVNTTQNGRENDSVQAGGAGRRWCGQDSPDYPGMKPTNPLHLCELTPPALSEPLRRDI